MPKLSPDRILALYDAAVACDFITEAQHDALLSGLPSNYTATLPGGTAPNGRLLQVLNRLNDDEPLRDGTVPLAHWLRNAVALVGQREHRVVFDDALRLIEAPGAPPSVRAAQPRRPPDDRAHVHAETLPITDRPRGAVNVKVVATFVTAGAVAGITLEITKASVLVFLLAALMLVFLLLGWTVRAVLVGSDVVSRATAGAKLSLTTLKSTGSIVLTSLHANVVGTATASLVLACAVATSSAELTARVTNSPPAWRTALKPASMPSRGIRQARLDMASVLPASTTSDALPTSSAPQDTQPTASASSSQAKDAAVESASINTEFDRAAATSALDVAAGEARACKKDDEPGGTARVKVTFAPNGSVISSSVDGPLFEGTRLCIAAAFRRAHILPFDGLPVTVSKSISTD